MRASIVRCEHLDIQRVVPAIEIVLNPGIRELDVALLVAWEVVFACPCADLVNVTIGPAVAVFAVTIPFLEELLVLPL